MSGQWDARIRRATELASVYPFAAEGLRFYIRLAGLQRNLCLQFQPELARSPTTAVRSFAEHQLDAKALLPRFSSFLAEIVQIAPKPLAQIAEDLRQDESAARRALVQFWNGATSEDSSSNAYGGDAAQPLAWLFLQPYAECLAASCGPVFVDGTPSNCPVCDAKPIVGVLRPEGDGAKKSLICMLCAHEWRFRRLYCPACGEEREPQLAVYSSAEIPNVRVDVCDTCRTYLKTVDLTKTGLPVPIIDELVALPLDLWAREHGYEKLHINLLGI